MMFIQRDRAPSVKQATATWSLGRHRYNFGSRDKTVLFWQSSRASLSHRDLAEGSANVRSGVRSASK